jgi:copper(I)-binding protein
MAGLRALCILPGNRGSAPAGRWLVGSVADPVTRWLVVLLASWMIWLPQANPAADSPIVVSDPWIREPPPSASVLAAYMRIGNRSPRPIHLLGITSAQFEKIELHRTEIVDGTARMAEVETLTIEPGKQIELEPGGLHAMLYGPNRTLREGEQVPLQLRFDDGLTLSVMARVHKAPGTWETHHHH